MIKCHLSRLMGENKLNMADIERETGISRKTISNLYYEKTTMYDQDILDKLCKFFKCGISELLEYVETLPSQVSEISERRKGVYKK
jgi:putative transcriptional regulator